jgi:hypothetical protein
LPILEFILVNDLGDVMHVIDENSQFEITIAENTNHREKYAIKGNFSSTYN